MAVSGEVWRIPPDERAKNEAQFFSLNPINNVITGDQARGLFLQSGLPPAILGQIWALADMNADGKMDKKEFCIAMHLIQKKLQGFAVPKVLPQSLLMEVGYGGMGRGVPVAGFAAAPMTTPPAPAAAASSGDWGVPQSSKLKYTQKFNMLDKSKKGYLTGLEAREVLTQSNLTHNLLAQIWNLSDIDKDGKLTTDEFVLSMFLVDQAKTGKVLPTKLPPDLVPPSYRRPRAGSGVSATPTGIVQMTSPPGQLPGTPPAPVPGMVAQTDTFGDLLGGYNMSAPPVVQPETVLPEPILQVTFEDKRQENFMKGQAELERRRELLRAEQQKMEEERLAHERAEHERRERVRLEQERKKQQEMEKLLQKQRELEEQRDEQRRKALEQREAARRELERQRQLEWERQRREQLMSEKLREQNQVDQMKSEVGKLKMELETLEARKGELHIKISSSRSGVTEFTNSIDGMRSQRDDKLADIEKFQQELMTWNEKYQEIQSERERLDQNVQLLNSTTSDTYRTVMHSYNSKKQSIEKLKASLENMETDTATKLEEIDTVNATFNEINIQMNDVNNKHQELMSKLDNKQDEWKRIKRQRDGIPSPLEETTQAPKNKGSQSNAWGFDSAFSTTATGAGSDVWGAGNAFGASDASTAITTNGEDMWGSDAFGGADVTTDAFGFGTSSSQSSSFAWASDFFTKTEDIPEPGVSTYRAMFQFDARNPDELTLIAEDVIKVQQEKQEGAEPGWIFGTCQGKGGWFPQAYVELIHDAHAEPDTNALEATPTPEMSAVLANEQPAVVIQNSFETDFSELPARSEEAAQVPSTLNLSQESSFKAVTTSTAAAPSPTPGQGKQAEEGLKAQALYPWRAKKENHLTFNKGDVLTVHEQQDMWWSGALGNRVGWFPKSYVKVLGASAGNDSNSMDPQIRVEGVDMSSVPAPEQNGGAEHHVAIYAYSSSEPGDLTFNQGDVIQVTKKDGDWWTGMLGAASGIFPANYVKMMDTQPGKLNKKPEIANVIAAYQATGQEQLSLMPGQLIQVRKKSNSGWWEGELQARGQKRKIGWFPANYVKLLGPSSARSTPDPNRASLTSSPLKCGSPSLSDSGSRTETPQPPQPTGAPALEQVMAVFTYEAQNDDELSFHKGSIINVVLKDDPDWWKGEVNGITGLFPSNYVSSLTDAVLDSEDNAGTSWPWSQHLAMSPTENKRQSAIQELIDTEETYVKDMKTVSEAFIKPLLAENCFSQEDVQRVFVNWKELIMCNTKLLKALRVRKKMTGEEQIIHMIGDILCEKLPHMTVYIRFCSCQLNAAALIQDKYEKDTNSFKDIHRKCIQHTGTKGMPLSSFLLKPIQRITKYPLLIEKILQNAPPEHPDNQNLQDALAKATEICQQVNEGVREKENSDRLEWIQNRVNCEGLAEKITFNSVTNCLGPRKFLYSGTLCKAKSGKELVGFLFNDFLLLVQPQRPLGQMASVFSLDIKTSVNFRMYRTPVFLNEVMIRKMGEGEAVDPCLFHLSHIDRVYSLKAVTATERDTWVKKIEEASRHYIETERKKRERAHSLRRAAALGRLLVVIMEGCKLTQGEDGKSDPYCEVSMGVQEHRTKVINNTLNPKWNASMQFTIKDLQEDILSITVYDRDLFTPNDFLGRTEVRIKDIVKETREKKGPISKRLMLHEVDSGEVVVKLDLQIYDIS